MDESQALPTGSFEARYRAFLATVETLRPSLHRYCARMTGSVLDGEDVAQEALFVAYRKLDQFDDSRPLKPWLFRIAHHRCIDFLRSRGVRRDAEAVALELEDAEPAELTPPLERAIEHLVLHLPPKERACVLLKDVLDYSLEEIAELVDSTTGGVKAALSRGRAKLAALPEPAEAAAAAPESSRLLALYVERFNSRDWDGLRQLTSADAQLRVADRYLGKLAEAPYFSTYAAWPTPWRLTLGHVEGVPVVVIHLQSEAGWTPTGVVRFELDPAGRIVGIADYLMCPWVLEHAEFRATS
jgi:RNA polymerase sigma-70 factor (ECF subfamily)